MAKTFEELYKEFQSRPKMYGGTFEIHYKEDGMKMVAFVEAYSKTKSGVRKAAIEKAETEQFIKPETIMEVRKFD